MRRILGALVLGLLAFDPAFAAESKNANDPQTVALQPVALPVIVRGQLINYVFVSISLDLGPKADGALVRAKEPFFRDDLVRVGHKTPFTRPDDYGHVDERRVRAEVMRYAAQVLGSGVVRAVTITRQESQKAQTLPVPPRRPAAEIIP